jgi:uncharacterized protein (TIGR03083 family)
MSDVYSGRLDALEETWRVWAELGAGLTGEQWATATRCPGWDVAAVYAHHSAFPLLLSTPPGSTPAGATGEPATAAEVLRGFNAPGGVAHTMAKAVADKGVSDAAELGTGELLDRFGERGPQAVRGLRQADPTLVVPWGPGFVTIGEGIRIVLLEATVHLLDVLRALGRPPVLPASALTETARLLAEVAPAVELIEAATGRSAHSPLPVLR